LTSWLGNPPKYGWDYCELKGQGAMITVAHKQSRDGSKTYANIVGISPVIDQLKAQVLPLEAFAQALASAQPQSPAPGTQASQPAPQHPQSPAGGYQQPSMPPQGPPPAAAPQQAWNPATDSQMDCPF